MYFSRNTQAQINKTFVYCDIKYERPSSISIKVAVGKVKFKPLLILWSQIQYQQNIVGVVKNADGGSK